MWKLMDDPKTGLENLDIKINKAVDNIIDNNLLIKASKKVTPHVAVYSPITQMISEMSGAGSTSTIQNALLQNPRFKDKEFLETFRYLNRAHAKDFVGLPFDEAFEYAKYRQGGLEVKGMLSYTTRYQNPESNIMNFAVRHANGHFRDGTKSQVQFYKLRADGTKGALMSWDKLPKNRDGNRVLDLKKVGFEYKNQFFHRNNLKTKGYRSGLFDEVYAMSGKNRLLVPDPRDLSKKVTLKKLLQMTGDRLTIGHDEALGGVKGAPFKNLRIQGAKLNLALFAAYDKIQNKDLRARVVHSLEGQFKGLSEDDYQKAFVEGKTKEAKDIINKKIDVSKRDTLYREAGQKIVDDPVFKTFSPKKQREAMRIAGNKIMQTYQANGIGGHCKIGKKLKKAEGGRIGFGNAGMVGYDECMTNAIQDHNKNLQSDNRTIRDAARSKQFRINQTKSMKNLIGVGLKGGKGFLKTLRAWGAELEPIFEGGFYEYYRRQGYKHNQALEETFFTKMFPKSWQKKLFGVETQTGLLEGADPLLEKERYEIKDESGNVVGSRKGVKRHIDNTAAMGEIEKEHSNIDQQLQEIQLQSQQWGTKADAETVERLKNRQKELIDEWYKLDRLTKEGTSDWQMHQAAVEKQQTEQGVRGIEYGQWGQGDTETLAKRREELRQRAMDKKYPNYLKYEMDKILENWGVGLDENILKYKKDLKKLEYIPYYFSDKYSTPATYESFNEYLKNRDKMAYYAENFRLEKAGGGIATLHPRRPKALPPLSGPDSQGLAYLNNYATKRTE
jgi:hypothetical protein